MKICAAYIWLDNEQKPRSKTMVLSEEIKEVEKLPIWNFDGSSTGQASGENSEVLLKPVAIYPDPFRKNNNILVLCECLNPDMTPHKTNTRHIAKEIFDNDIVKKEKPWYGLEQEYVLLYYDFDRPIGWPPNCNFLPQPQKNYYCSLGVENVCGREVVELHLKCCLDAKLTISGINAEVMLGQWEYQIGPVESIDAADQLVISRYLLIRVCEQLKLRVTFEPKPVLGDWNGSGCHTNFSTKSMRENDDGLKIIIDSMEKLKNNHTLHMENYGKDNNLRMTGKHETASYEKFTYGVANRGCSVRIPRETNKNGKGYLEDRRPASNMDPYTVTSLLVKTILL
jgi:glutamine synthetase